MTERLARDLCLSTLDLVLERTRATEVTGKDGGPFQVLDLAPQPEGSPLTADGPLGSYRVWTTDGPVQKIVYAGISVDSIGMDTHMVYAFSDPAGAVPHFTLDSVQAHGILAFHLDLNPRVDLGVNLPYMDGVYGPLQELFDEGQAMEGLSPAAIGPRQRAIMSPWMLVYRATPEAYRQLGKQVTGYLDRWTELTEQGLPADIAASVKDVDLPGRDAANRALIFSRDVDKVWDQITPLVGQQTSELMRINLEFNDITREV